MLGAAFAGVPLDDDSTAAWSSALESVESRLGPVVGTALVAGGWSGGRPFHEEPDERTWRRMLDDNLETAQRALRDRLGRLPSDE